MPTRRSFLKSAALLSGAAGVSGVLPASIQRAFAIEPEPGSTYLDAEHIVILMQENRSFDHALGTLQGVRGFNDPRAIRLANGNSVFVQTDAKGDSYAPWRFDIKDTRITWMGSVPHSRDSQVDAWNEGQHDHWLQAKRSYSRDYADLPLTMGHYNREDIPFYYALADAFTVCDQSYCSVMSSTTPNRSVFWTGTIRDQQRADSKVFMRNDSILTGGMPWKTYPERLQQAGITWKFYQNELTNTGGLGKEGDAWLANYGCNLLEFFAAYNVEAYPGAPLGIQEQIASLQQQIARAEQQLPHARDASAAAQMRKRIEGNQAHIAKLKAALANCGETRYKQLSSEQKQLHDAAFVTNLGDPHYRSLEAISFQDDGKELQVNVPKGDVLHQFRQDVNEGKLPAVSWLSAPERFSDHPSNPWYGAWYVSEVMDILTKNPEVWKKTIFILTYDENDGYFDHAPSFVAADPRRAYTGSASSGIDTALEYTYAQDELDQGIGEKEARSGPIGMGFRVPTIVASPWSRGGWVNSQLFDHTSTLMFLEDFMQRKYRKTVREENISAWRRAISGDLTSCFRPYNPNEPVLDYLKRDPFVVSIQQARYKETPSQFRKLTAAEKNEISTNLVQAKAISHQEPGTRPSCALPYELYADGQLSPDGKTFDLQMKAGNQVHGTRSAGAPFNVYLHKVGGAPGTETGMRAATYAVKAGDTLQERFPLSLFQGGTYEIDVHGPNGFFRSFSGVAMDTNLQVQTTYEQHGRQLTGNVKVQLRNSGNHPAVVTVRDVSYKSGVRSQTLGPRSEASVVLALHASQGWYDFAVQQASSKASFRYAGRVETGRSSITDPLMAGV